MKVIGWIDYDNFNFATAEGTEEEICAVADALRENGYKFGGDDHENQSRCCPLLSNGKALRTSWRGWGGIMARAYDLRTDDGNYNYILWYMGEYAPEGKVLPTPAFLDLSDVTVGQTVTYEVSEEELHAIYNASFTNFVLPIERYNAREIHTLDTVIFSYHGNVLLKTVVNEIRFFRYSVDEFFEIDRFLSSSPSDNTNYRDFSPVSLRTFLKRISGEETDGLISLCFDIADDQRDAEKIYI